MRGVLESRRGEALVAREEWALDKAAGGRTLRARGEGEGAARPSWSLDTQFAPDDAPSSLEVQARA